MTSLSSRLLFSVTDFEQGVRNLATSVDKIKMPFRGLKEKLHDNQALSEVRIQLNHKKQASQQSFMD